MTNIEDSAFFEKTNFNFKNNFDHFDHFEIIHSNPVSPFLIYTAIKGFKRFTLKGLKPQYQDDPFYLAQLRKEFEIGYRIDHSNIAKYYSFEEIKGKGLCIIREWIDGDMLDTYIEKDRPSTIKIFSLLKELCDALSYLHKHLIIHGDLKPSNFLITNEGKHLKLIDFGFSDTPEYAIMKISGGTKAFASPEQMKEINFNINYKSDLYSLGKVIENLNFKKSPKLKRLVARLVSKNPMERPQLSEITEFFEKKSKPFSFNLGSWGMAILFCFLLIFILKFNINPPQNINHNQKESSSSINIKEELVNGELTGEKELVNQNEAADPKRYINKEKQEINKIKDETENLMPIQEESKDKKNKMDVHPMEIITYNETLAVARRNFKLYPDSIKDWKDATQFEIIKWLHDQLNNDEFLKSKCMEAMEKGLLQFESINQNLGSN